MHQQLHFFALLKCIKSINFWFVRVYLAFIFALWKDDGFMCGAGGRWGGNDSSVIFLQKTQNWLNRSLNVCSFWKYWRFSTALCRFPFPNISWRSNREPLIPFLPPSQTKVGEWVASVWILSWLYKHIILALPSSYPIFSQLICKISSLGEPSELFLVKVGYLKPGVKHKCKFKIGLQDWTGKNSGINNTGH